MDLKKYLCGYHLFFNTDHDLLRSLRLHFFGWIPGGCSLSFRSGPPFSGRAIFFRTADLKDHLGILYRKSCDGFGQHLEGDVDSDQF